MGLSLPLDLSLRRGCRQKIIYLSTTAGQSIKQNISDVFGVKLARSLYPLNLKFSYMTLDTSPSGTNVVELSGYVSRPDTIRKQCTVDRQIGYVNAMPCHIPSIFKAVTQTFQNFKFGRPSFILINLRIEPGLFDTSLSIDKSLLYIHKESDFLSSLRSAIASQLSAVSLYKSHNSNLDFEKISASEAKENTNVIKNNLNNLSRINKRSYHNSLNSHNNTKSVDKDTRRETDVSRKKFHRLEHKKFAENDSKYIENLIS